MSEPYVPWRPKGPLQLNPLARLTAWVAIWVYKICKPIVQLIPGPILLAALGGAVAVAWVGMAAFDVVDAVASSEANTEATSYFGGPLQVVEIENWFIQAEEGTTQAWIAENASPAVWVAKYVFWVLQWELLRDLVGIVAVLVIFNAWPVYAIWWERKVAGRIQSRLGPMCAGCWHGWAQCPADGIKLIIKEDLVPDEADKPLFRASAYFAFTPIFMCFCALPLGTYWVFRNLDVALLFILAMLGTEVMSVIIGGWASNNKWSMYGGMREACQMVSYEIPMTTVLLIPIMTAGTLNLVAVGDLQSGGWHEWVAFSNPFAFVAFVTYFLCSLASCKRAPFDLPEAESELVGGYHTEYSGFRWAMFFFAEYVSMMVVSGLAVTLFLGAWHSPLPMSWALAVDGQGFWMNLVGRIVNGLMFSSPLWFLAKCVFFLYVQLWLRWTLPRIRIDQVLYACVQVLFPISLVALVGHAFWLLLVPDGSVPDLIVNVILSLIGAGFLGIGALIAGYGFMTRRKQVGYLAVNALPGS